VRLLLLTSTFQRHQYLINRAAERFDVVGVWQERKSFDPLRYAANAEDEQTIARHFTARDASEADWFAGDREVRLRAGVEHRTVPPAACNAREEIARMVTARPDVVLVFGTGILRADLIDAFAGRILNLHLGLSPYYRGAGTNFWPLVNREPEFVGATIHYLDAGIDTGPIIAHARPELRVDDRPHDIGNRTIVTGVDVLLRAAAQLSSGLAAVPQTDAGRVYQRKDFSADAVRRLHQNFASGMIPEYLADRGARDARFSLQTLPADV